MSEIRTIFLLVFDNDTGAGGDAVRSSNPGKGWTCSREGQLESLASWGRVGGSGWA